MHSCYHIAIQLSIIRDKHQVLGPIKYLNAKLALHLLTRVDKEEECLNATIVFRRLDVIIIVFIAISSVAIKILRVVQCKLAEALMCTWLAVSYGINRTAVHLLTHP